MAIFNDTKFKPGYTDVDAQTFTVDDDAYTTGDVVGGLITIPIGGAGGGGVVRDVYLMDKANNDCPFTLYLFAQKPTIIADDAAFDAGLLWADLTAPKLIKKYSILAGHYVDIVTSDEGTVSWAHIDDLAWDFEITDGNLYAYLEDESAGLNPAAADDFAFALGVWRN